MCDGCGCDLKPLNPYTRKAKLPQHKDGWHIHADGSVHKHEHPQTHEHTTHQVAPHPDNKQGK